MAKSEARDAYKGGACIKKLYMEKTNENEKNSSDKNFVISFLKVVVFCGPSLKISLIADYERYAGEFLERLTRVILFYFPFSGEYSGE